MGGWSKGMTIWLALSILFIYLVDLFTVNPNVISGNGNLGLLFVFPALVIFYLAIFVKIVAFEYYFYSNSEMKRKTLDSCGTWRKS